MDLTRRFLVWVQRHLLCKSSVFLFFNGDVGIRFEVKRVGGH